MTLIDFNRIVTEQLDASAALLTGKGQEYAEKATAESTTDRLAHFKKAAALQGVSTAEAAFGMLAKHLVSVSDMVGNASGYSAERWKEKITDSINYLLILRAIVEEASTK